MVCCTARPLTWQYLRLNIFHDSLKALRLLRRGVRLLLTQVAYLRACMPAWRSIPMLLLRHHTTRSPRPESVQVCPQGPWNSSHR